MTPTREEVIRVARECGFHIRHDSLTGDHWLAQHDVECFDRLARHFYEAGLKDAEKHVAVRVGHLHIIRYSAGGILLRHDNGEALLSADAKPARDKVDAAIEKYWGPLADKDVLTQQQIAEAVAADANPVKETDEKLSQDDVAGGLVKAQPAEQAKGQEVVAIRDLPLGARFTYPEYPNDVWVLLDRHECGLCAKWSGPNTSVVMQSLCSIAESREELLTLKVIQADTTQPAQPAREEYLTSKVK